MTHLRASYNGLLCQPSKLETAVRFRSPAPKIKNEKFIHYSLLIINLTRLYQIIVKPIDTEKSLGNQKIGKFTFLVKNDANKSEIKNAVEKYYDVKVKNVATIKIQPKTRKAGRREIQKRAPTKKAVITTVGAKKIDANKLKTI